MDLPKVHSINRTWEEGQMLNRIESRPKCGEIWMADLGKGKDSIQGGYRPVFVLSNDINNTHSPNVNIVPLTSKKKRRLPMHVELIDYTKYGLSAPSTLLMEQVTTVSAVKLEKYIGEISDQKTLDNIRDAILVQFPILHRGILH